MPANHPAKPPEHPGDWLSYNREDFAVLSAEFRTRTHDRVDKLLGFGVIGGLMIGWGLISLAQARGWPNSLQGAFFALGWGIAIVPAAYARLRQTRIRQALGLECPNCGTPLVTLGRSHQVSDHVLATGTCPSCSHLIFPKSNG